MRQEGRKTAWSSLAALGVVALLAAGCTQASVPPKRPVVPQPSGPQIFRGMLNGYGATDIATLDPDIVQDTVTSEVVKLLYDGLVTLDARENVELWGAKKIDVSADGLTYTFHLRDHQAFADGTPVLASDYAFSLNRSANPCMASPVANYVGTIKDAATFSAELCKNGVISPGLNQTGPVIQTLIGDSITTPDAKTLVITLAQAGVYFLAQLTYPTAYALDPAVVGSDITSEKWLDTLSQGATGQGTSGMFYVSTWDHAAGQLVLRANPHWWGLAAGKRPHLTEIDWALAKNGASAYAAYAAGQDDMTFVTPDQLAQAQGRPDVHTVQQLTDSAVVLMNWAQPPFDNLNVRLAFCLAIDRDALVASVKPGTQLPSWHIVPQGMPGYNPTLNGPEGVTSTHGDPARAQAHWQAYRETLHGAPVPPIYYLDFDLSTSKLTLGQALQRQWQAVLGVNVTLRHEGGPSVFANDNGYQMEQSSWFADYPDPQDFLSNLFLPGSVYNTQSANVPAANGLMRAADVNPNPAQRLQQYQQAEQLLVNQVAWCPIAQAVDHYLLRSYVHSWVEGPEGVIPNVEGGQGVTPNDAWVATYITAH